MNFSEEELERQASEIRSKLVIVFVPIAIIVGSIIYYQNTSMSHLRGAYEKSRADEFGGKITKMKEEGTHVRAERYIVLDKYYDKRTDYYVYDKLSIGDQVVKRKGEDTVYYFLKSGETLRVDYNKYIREKYFETLTKKK